MNEVMDVWDIAFPHLNIYLHNVPKSFSVFGFSIALYGVVIALGMIAGFSLAARLAKYNGFDGECFWDFAIYAIIFGIIGARIYYVVFAWDKYKDDLVQVFNIRNGGLAIYGGLIAGFTTLFIFCHIKKINPLSFADAAVPGICIGQIMGRWGNFFNREAFGQYTDSLFAMRLPIDAVRSSDISAGIAEHIVEGTNYIQVHPTFLYEGLWNLALMLFLIFMTKRKAFNGQIMSFYFLGYGIGRLWIEGLRTDQLKIGHTDIAVSQVVCVMIIILAIVLNVVFIRKKKTAAEEVPAEAEKIQEAPVEAEKIQEEPAEAEKVKE